MKFYTISGIDGSGKTTQRDLLKNHLEKNGEKVHTFHAISFSLANKINCSFLKKPSKTTEKPKAKTSASFVSIFLRKTFLFLDVLRFRCYLKKLKKQGTTVLLADRYFFDQIINIAYLEKRESLPFSIPLCQGIIEKMIVRPDRAFYIKTDPEVAISRERDIEQGIEYLKQKKSLYDSAQEKFAYISVDGNKNKEEVFSELLGKI